MNYFCLKSGNKSRTGGRLIIWGVGQPSIGASFQHLPSIAFTHSAEYVVLIFFDITRFSFPIHCVFGWPFRTQLGPIVHVKENKSFSFFGFLGAHCINLMRLFGKPQNEKKRVLYWKVLLINRKKVEAWL